MVVEDDQNARDLVKRILTDAGATVIEAPNAAADLAIIGSADVNCLVSDIGMAGQDGYELIRALRARGYSSVKLQSPETRAA